MGAVFVALLANGVTVAAAFQATALGSLMATAVGRLLTSVALSALISATMKPTSAGGFSTKYTASGGTNPLSFILGRYATAGDMVCPPMSHGQSGKTPNAYLTYVISLGDIAGQTLESMIVDGEHANIGTTPHPDYGYPIYGPYSGYAWVKYYDGTQTAADAMLLDKYGSYPERPWASDMVLTGSCYAIVTFRYNRELFQGLPQVRFQMGGIALYDPRLDTTAGGSGSQRWSDRGTWAVSRNPMVQIYNIMRGIEVPGLGVWGGGCAAEDLPLSSWFAAMNECDVAVSLSGGGTEPAWRAGIEVTVDKTPADIGAELLKACSGQMAEVGGIWKPRVGGPGLPVYYMTDDDIVISRPQELDPFPGLDERFNAVTATYPDPEALWEPKDAPPLYNAAWETEDAGQRLVAALQLPAAPFAAQVQRLMKAGIQEERRFRRHQATLPPDALILEPLDSVSWTSTRNGYAAKVFEVSQVADDQRRLLPGLALRERDSADYVWVPGYEKPYSIPSAVRVTPADQAVPGWNVGAVILSDGISGRRPALRLSWSADGQDDQSGLQYEIRLKLAGILASYGAPGGQAAGIVIDTINRVYASDLDGWAGEWSGYRKSLILDGIGGRFGADANWTGAEVTTVILRGVITDIAAGEVYISDGLLPSTDYEARAIYLADRPTSYSAWMGATTAATYITNSDYEGGVQELFIGAGISAPEIVTSLPTTGNYPGRMVLLTTDYKLYRYTGTMWTSAVPMGDVTGQALATDILIANSITGGLIAAAGIITQAAQIDDAVINTAHIADLAVDTLQIAGNAVTLPVHANRSGNPVINVTSATTFTEVLALNIPRSGAPLSFRASVALSAYGNGVGHFQVWRDGKTNLAGYIDSTPGGRAISVSFTGLDASTLKGTHKYSLMVKKGDPSHAGGWNANLTIGSAFFEAVETKK